MSSQFQIVFNGQLLDGFELAAVKASAMRRLKAAPEQIERVFSGKRAVLKKGLTDEIAQRYASELQRIGMRVLIEPELVKAPAAVSGPAAQEPIDPIGAIDSLPTALLPTRNEPQRVTSRDAPAFDPMKTQISVVADDLLPPPPDRWLQPTIAISQKHLNALQASNATPPPSGATAEPTLTVARSSEPTIVVTRGSASNAPGLSARDSAASEPTMIVPPRRSISDSNSSAPTMIVPPRNSAASESTMIVPPRRGVSDSDSSAPTMIVPPRQSSASDPTLIVPPRRSATSSEPTMIVPPRQSAAAQPTIIVRSNQKLPSAAKADAEPGFDSEKTLIAPNDAVEEYLAPAPDANLAAAPPRPLAPHASSLPSATVEEVQCPTCGDKQPKRVYCRRCGHALSLPPRPSMGESTITKKPFTQPPGSPAQRVTNDETVLVDEIAEPPKKSTSRDGFLAAPTWFTIGLMFVLLLAIAGWLLFT